MSFESMPDPKKLMMSKAVEDFGQANQHLREDGTITFLKTATETVPFPFEKAEYERGQAWVDRLVEAKLIPEKDANRYLDIVLNFMEFFGSSKGIGSVLAQKIEKKLIRYKQSGHDPEGAVTTLLTLLADHPLTTEKEYDIDLWLGELLTQKLIKQSDYYRYLDILTSEA